MTICAHTERLIPLLYDGELDGPIRRELSTHLAGCAECSRTLAVLGRGQELLRQAIEEEVDEIDFARFWKGVEEKLLVQPLPWTARMRLWSEQWRPRWAFSPPLWAVVAACLLLGISLWSGQLPFQLTRTDPPPRSTTTKNVTHEDSEPFALA